LTVASATTSPTLPPTLGETPPSRATLSEDAARKLELDVVQWCEGIFESATEDPDYQKETRETLKMIDFIFEGKQWADKSRFARNKPVLNKARRHYWENASLLTDLALDFQVKSFDHFDEYDPFEAMLNQLCVHWAMRNYFEDRTYDAVLYGLLHTGPSKLQWNSTLNGGMGDVDMVPIAPWQWATLGAGTNPQDAECIIYYPVVTKEHLVRRFGKTALRVECDADFGSALSGHFNRPGHINKQSWAAMGPALRRSLGIRSSAGSDDPYPKAILKELWMNDDSYNEKSFTVTVGPCDSNGEPTVNWAYRVEPGEKLYPRGRVICIAGGCVLEDQCNPYWHAKKPFPVYRPLRVPWQMSGNSTVKPWIQMNSVINKILGGSLDSLYAINEPTLVAPKAAFPAGDWESLDPGAAGGKIKYNNNSPKAPEFAKRAEFPFAPAMQAIELVNKEMNESSGASAISQAMSKKQVPGSDSLDMIISSRSLPVRVQSRALTSFIEDTGTMGVSDMLQFYSAAHRVAILGTKGISPNDYRPIYGSVYNSDSSMKPEEFVRRYQMVIRPDNTLTSQRSDKVQIAIALRKMGDLSSQELMRRLEPNFNFRRNRDELIQEAKLKLMLGAAQAALTGKGQGKKK
jgi:hypothetical protein